MSSGKDDVTGVEYTIIVEGSENRKIFISNEKTVKDAIDLINELLGESQTKKTTQPKKLKNKKVRIALSKEQKEQKEPIEIFGLSTYTDRSAMFNSIKFPNNELIVHAISSECLFLKSSIFLVNPDKEAP